MSSRTAIYLIMTWVVILVILALVSCAPTRAARCSNPDGCPSLAGLTRFRPATPPPLHAFQTPEEARTAHYMLERWPVEPLYRMRGE